jgi:hypothetical protein
MRIPLVKPGGRVTSSFARLTKVRPALSSRLRTAMTYVEKRSYLASVSTLNVVVSNTRCPDQQDTQSVYTSVTSQHCFPLFDISLSRMNKYHLIITYFSASL